MDSLKFKYKPINKKGNETGFFSKRGEVNEDEVILNKDALPIASIVQVVRRQKRLVLFVLTEDGPIQIALSITSGKASAIKEMIDRLGSATFAIQHKKQLEAVGKGHLFNAAVCPYCEATVDLSGYAESPEMYCMFCERIGVVDGEPKLKQNPFQLCDNCGYFSTPQKFTSFYFVFLLVVYFFQTKQSVRCHACMRGEAWKMFWGNLLFILGVPFALWQLGRAYIGGASRSEYPDLDAANHAAQKGKIDKAEALYLGIIDRNPSQVAGIHYNMAKASLTVNEIDGALGAARQSLAECSNYRPAAELIVQTLESRGLDEEAKLFWNDWNKLELAKPNISDDDSE